MLDFHPVEENLRESFRALAVGRASGDVLELPGLSIASLGVTYQMFNAAFLNSPVREKEELEARLDAARRHFQSRAIRWAFWLCEDWLDWRVRRGVAQTCQRFGLRLSSEMPGMAAARVFEKPEVVSQPIEIRRVDSTAALNDFRAVGSLCFHVPQAWFSEVFNQAVLSPDHGFRCYVGYDKGAPVATSASVESNGVLGIYNVATAPSYRGKGFGEAMTRHAVCAPPPALRGRPIVLQSTTQGLRIYERLGFRSVTRIIVYNSL